MNLSWSFRKHELPPERMASVDGLVENPHRHFGVALDAPRLCAQARNSMDRENPAYRAMFSMEQNREGDCRAGTLYENNSQQVRADLALWKKARTLGPLSCTFGAKLSLDMEMTSPMV